MSQRLEVVAADTAPPVWAALRNEAAHAAQTEPGLASLLHSTILKHDGLAEALSYQLARKIGDQELRAMSVREIAEEAYGSDPTLIAMAEADLRAVFERDPACKGYMQPFLFFKGFLALQTRMSEVFQVDINPAARIGSGVFVDHGTGIVIGETVVIGDDVSILQGVTLGGTGAERGDRHPKIGKGVLLGAGATVIGNIVIGDYAKIASGAVVLRPVPPGCTAVGVPARLVNCPTCDEPARTMDHTLAEHAYDDPSG